MSKPLIDILPLTRQDAKRTKQMIKKTKTGLPLTQGRPRIDKQSKSFHVTLTEQQADYVNQMAEKKEWKTAHVVRKLIEMALHYGGIK